MNMINKFVQTLSEHKTYLVIAIAALAILAYAVPYGIDVEAKRDSNQGKHYGTLVEGDGYGVFCDNHGPPGKGPAFCR